MRRFALGAAALGGAVAIVVVVVASSGTSSRAGRTAPALPTTVLVGPRVTVAALRGRPAAINFWASWCGPCRREASGFARLPARLGARARLVGVDWNDGERNARAFIRRFGWRFPNLRDVDGLAGDRYGLAGLPTTYILDRRGRIVSMLQGPQTARAVEARLLAVR